MCFFPRALPLRFRHCAGLLLLTTSRRQVLLEEEEITMSQCFLKLPSLVEARRAENGLMDALELRSRWLGHHAFEKCARRLRRAVHRKGGRGVWRQAEQSFGGVRALQGARQTGSALSSTSSIYLSNKGGSKKARASGRRLCTRIHNHK